jgi:hypothetical protein
MEVTSYLNEESPDLRVVSRSYPLHPCSLTAAVASDGHAAKGQAVWGLVEVANQSANGATLAREDRAKGMCLRLLLLCTLYIHSAVRRLLAA